MRRRMVAAIGFRRRELPPLLVFPTCVQVLFEFLPLRLLRVLVFLTGIAMLAARTPAAIPRAFVAIRRG